MDPASTVIAFTRHRDATTQPSLVADATVSGYVRDIGLRYVLGVYNVMDTRYAQKTLTELGVMKDALDTAEWAAAK